MPDHRTMFVHEIPDFDNRKRRFVMTTNLITREYDKYTRIWDDDNTTAWWDEFNTDLHSVDVMLIRGPDKS